MSSGYIYILINPTLGDGLVKIGKTTRSSDKRAAELSQGSEVVGRFYVAYQEFVLDCHSVKREIHAKLEHRRYRADREFFQMPLQEAIAEVTRICCTNAPTELLIKKAAELHDKEEFEQAIPFWEAAAARGDAEGLYNMAELCWGDYDDIEGERLMALAADQNYIPAMLSLCDSYYTDSEITNNIELVRKSLFWAERAAQLGSTEGSQWVARIVAVDRPGYPANNKKAFDHFMIAAKAGDIGCQVEVGISYEFGLGTEKDCGKAIEWYANAHQGGHQIAGKLAERLRTGIPFTELHYLIDEYTLCAETLFPKIAEHLQLELPISAAAWRNLDIRARGKTKGGTYYYKHGIGIQMSEICGKKIDLELSEAGEIDGFDALRLFNFQEENKKHGAIQAKFDTYEQVKKAVDTQIDKGYLYVKGGLVFRRREARQD